MGKDLHNNDCNQESGKYQEYSNGVEVWHRAIEQTNAGTSDPGSDLQCGQRSHGFEDSSTLIDLLKDKLTRYVTKTCHCLASKSLWVTPYICTTVLAGFVIGCYGARKIQGD